MYASRAACSRCSTRIPSISTTQPNAVARYATAANRWGSSKSATFPKPSHGKGPDHRHKVSRRKPGSFEKTSKRTGDSALELFNDVVKPASKPEDGSPKPPTMSELQVSARLKRITERDQSITTQLEVLRDEIIPYIQHMRGHVSRPIYLTTTQLLRSIHGTVVKKGIDGLSLEISQAYNSLGQWELSTRNDLLLNICAKLIGEKHSSRVRTQLVDELINLWKDITQLKRMSEVDQGLRFALPSLPEVLADTERYINGGSPPSSSFYSKSPVSRGLAAIFLQYPPTEARDILPGLLATVAVVSDTRISGPSRQLQLRPLLQLVRAVVNKFDMSDFDINFIFSNKTDFDANRLRRLKTYVINQWPCVRKMFADNKQNWNGKTAVERTDTQDADQVPNPKVFHKQLRLAYRALNHGAIIHIWESMLSGMQQHESLKEQLREDPLFFDYWVFVWCACKKLTYLEETLALMRDLGLEPSIKTYTAMMHGFKMSREVKLLEGVWNQLTTSNVKLDGVIWTERISGLIELGRAQEGIIAISELVSTWKQAVKEGKEAQAVQPTIEIINAAFKGLLRMDPKAAHELLAWAGREGFQPNVRTYNILMSESLRDGRTDDVQNLLRAMQAQGIEPDAATFTIILEQVIGQLKHATSAEQVQAVKHVLADIEGAGITPNLETYGKMLHSIANIASGSEDAIAAVQDHMRSKGFTITPHMITILIERAMARNPPDIDAVRAILQEHNYTSVDQGDRTLWERVMSAYAVADEVKDAMQIFDDLARKGRPATSLACLAELMQALIRANDMETARRVVGMVLAHKMHTREDSKERHWRHHFWFLAKKHGLMSGKLDQL